jgi:acetate CoA/acetoacetate CoA-transferase beta subunit
MALRAVKEFNDGDCVNLGAGLPLQCALFIPEGKDVFFEAQNGVLGYGHALQVDEWEKADFDYVDAGFRPINCAPGMSFFDMAISFDIIIGGHLDATVLGALEVSEKGDLANWTRGLPEEGGIGGSMDLAVGAKKVIILMTHTTNDGQPKIVRECTFPLTARACVDLIITDIAVIQVINNGLVLKEVAPGWSTGEVQALTEPKLKVSYDLREMEL